MERVQVVTMMSNPWSFPWWRTRSAQAQHISFAKLVVRVGAVCPWCMWLIVGMGRHEFWCCLRRGLCRWSSKVNVRDIIRHVRVRKLGYR
jgi:hypothetical protein